MCMPKVSDNTKEAIHSLRDYGFSKRAVAEFTGVSRPTVMEHEPEDAEGYNEDLDKTWEDIQEGLHSGIEIGEAIAEEWLPEDIDSKSAAEVKNNPYTDDVEKRLRPVDDPEQYSPGEFIEEFFEDLGAGVNEKFVSIMSRRADRSGELPDEEKMRADLEALPSGVSNKTAEYIAEDYWAAAKHYISNTPTDVGGRAVGESSNGESQGSTIPVNGQSQQQGGWVQLPDGTTQYGRMERKPDGRMEFVPMTPPGQQRQPGQQPPGRQPAPQAGAPPRQQGGTDPEMKQMMQMMMKKLDDDGGSESVAEEFQRVQELQQVAREMVQDEPSEANQALLQEIRAMRSQIAEGGQSAPEDPKQAMVHNIIDNDEVDPDKALEALERVDSPKNEEVRKKEIERDIEMQKMQQKAERQQKIVSSLEGVVETLGQAVGESIRGGDGDQQAQTDSQPQMPAQGGQPTTDGSGAKPQTQQPQQNPQGVAEGANAMPGGDWECPECGETTQHPPGTSGKECQHCGFSRLPCPDCEMPLDIPPRTQAERGGCPDCGAHVPGASELDRAVCPQCDWEGDAEEATGAEVECDSCGSVHTIGAPAQ